MNPSLNREILGLILNNKNPNEAYLCESKVINETYKCLMESVVNWMYIQIQLIRDIIDNPEVNSWGHGFDTEMGADWSSYDFKRKATMLMTYFSKTGILAKLRNHMNSSREVIRVGTNDYDIKDIEMDFVPNSNEFLNAFRSSAVYKDLIDICMNGLKSGLKAA
jgi:hypothetical protein